MCCDGLWQRLVSRGGWEGDFRQLATRARHPTHSHLIQDSAASSEGRDSHLTQDSAVSSEGREGGSSGGGESRGVVRRWVREWGRGVSEQPVITAAHDKIQGRGAETQAMSSHIMPIFLRPSLGGLPACFSLMKGMVVSFLDQGSEWVTWQR